jgi:hypothetical protein
MGEMFGESVSLSLIWTDLSRVGPFFLFFFFFIMIMIILIQRDLAE